MIAISESRLSPRENWVTIGFASTLYLCPILELLLADIPAAWQAELRLGLQEALVNAAKHGNKLDPSKKVSVRFSAVQDEYWWVISDQGQGYKPSCECGFHSHNLNDLASDEFNPEADRECGRGLFILDRIFDRVEWNAQGNELTLVKHLKNSSRLPLVR